MVCPLSMYAHFPFVAFSLFDIRKSYKVRVVKYPDFYLKLNVYENRGICWLGKVRQ